MPAKFNQHPLYTSSKNRVQSQRAVKSPSTEQPQLASLGFLMVLFTLSTPRESLDHIIVATPGLRSDTVALGVIQDKDLFVQFTDPNILDLLISSHLALVNAIILVLHSAESTMPT
ncbi:Ubiquitin-like protein 7 [Channa argus]|uniref:Ubiquitin-like protein 7 n=1 Tax=Channa argus TaxID=215402 RepID=A0A6G1QZD4_CHAAH|nr:Ubiquitin-like protein 7 [Channa argus]